MIDTLVNIAGIFGFILSLSIALHGLLSRRVRLSVCDAQIYAVTSKRPDTILVFVTCTICNHAATPISVTSGFLSFGDVRTPLLLDKSTIIGAYHRNPDYPAALWSSQFPLSLNPMEARRYTLQVHLQQQLIESLPRQAVADSLHMLQENSVPPRGYPPSGTLPVCLELTTNRRPTRCHFATAYGDAFALWEQTEIIARLSNV